MRIIKRNGFTLIEMLVVTFLFAGLAVLVGSLVGNSMKGVRKSESAIKVRSELENAVSIVERFLRGAKAGSVSCNSSSLTFTDQNDMNVVISCSGSSPKKLVMGSSDLTGSNINLVICSFDCSYLSSGVVIINLTATNLNSSGVEADIATVSSRIVLRNY